MKSDSFSRYPCLWKPTGPELISFTGVSLQPAANAVSTHSRDRFQTSDQSGTHWQELFRINQFDQFASGCWGRKRRWRKLSKILWRWLSEKAPDTQTRALLSQAEHTLHDGSVPPPAWGRVHEGDFLLKDRDTCHASQVSAHPSHHVTVCVTTKYWDLLLPNTDSCCLNIWCRAGSAGRQLDVNIYTFPDVVTFWSWEEEVFILSQ